MSVYDLVGLLGQSLVTGYTGTQPDGTAAIPSCDPALCKDWDGAAGNSVVQPLIEPHAGGFTNAYKPQDTSLAPAYANTFTDVSGRPLLIVRTAIGGTPLLQDNAAGNQNWSPTGVLFTQAMNRIIAARNALTAAGHTIGHLHIVWSQGYRDALIGSNLAGYQAAMEALPGRAATALGLAHVPFYTELNYAPEDADGDAALIGRCNQVRNAQLAAVASTPDLHIAFSDGEDFSVAGGEVRASDRLHYTQKGSNLMGTGLASYSAVDLFGDEAPAVLPTSHAARLFLMALPLDYPDPPEEVVAAFVRDHPGGQNKTTATTTVLALGADVAAEHTLLVSFTADNAATTGPNVTGISKPVGEARNWQLVGKVAAASGSGTTSVVTELWGIRTSQAWPAAFTPTVTLDVSRAAKAGVIKEFSGLTLTLRAPVVTAVSLTGAPVAVRTGVKAKDVCVAGGGWEQTGVITGDADTTGGAWSTVLGNGTTGGANDAANVRSTLQHKIVTTDSDQTYNPTGAANDSAVVLAALIPG